MKKYYNLTIEDYQNKLTNQLSGCSICGNTIMEMGKSLNVDHDHKTGKVRELLCHNCNIGLGNFKDNPELLLKSFLYLIKHKTL